jgi:hypothetical protein
VSRSARIPFNESVRLFWHHLIPIALLPTVIICVVGLIQKAWAFWLIVPLFYGCGFYAGLPYLRKNATYWFWVFACCIWVLGAIPGMLFFAALKALLGIHTP